ncbi:hypothetical protein KUTeg_002408 [Tegillarca granosa]|uniref:FZ domain-containing protein n=1 Tax=Tegillarca granosa TaxID=220873 RepID=A0ABQ9FVP2_TEGGR|nr:hypothetical protein KUTeg_002408 [Tegillarca granosa]
MADIWRRLYFTYWILSCCVLVFKNGHCQLSEFSNGKCEPMRVKFCENLPYNETILPNALNENDQDQIALQLDTQYRPLVNIECSDQLIPLLCFVYVPVCTVMAKPIPPCRKICMQAKAGCEKIVNNFGFPWPDVLKCENFPISGLCVGENYTSSSDITTSADQNNSVTPKLPNQPDQTSDVTVLENVQMLIDVGPATVSSIAVDWLTNKLFWLESYPSRVRVSDLDGHNPTTLLSKGLGDAKSMVIDPKEGCLFWLVWVGDLYSRSATIEKLDLKTKKHTVIFNITQDIIPNMGRPVDMAADLKNKRLYWVDARSESIQKIDYHGKNFEVMIKGGKYLREPQSIALFGQHIYWSDRESQSVFKALIGKGGKVETLKTLTASPALEVKVFHQYAQPSAVAPYNVTLIPSSAVSGYKQTFYYRLFSVIFLSMIIRYVYVDVS